MVRDNGVARDASEKIKLVNRTPPMIIIISDPDEDVGVKFIAKVALSNPWIIGAVTERSRKEREHERSIKVFK
jgi:hypothetical protein